MQGDDPTTSAQKIPASAGAERFEILVIASSAGGVGAVRAVLSALPGHFPIPVVVVQHLDPRHRTVIAEVLGRHSPLTVKLAEADDLVKPGFVYVAPPDHHLLVSAQGALSLSQSALVHFVRPSADLLFESAAGAFGSRVVACVLTGTGSDGAMGVSAVKSRGGTVIVEDPATAEFRGMPDAAVATGNADFVLPLDEIPQVILGLVEAGGTN